MKFTGFKARVAVVLSGALLLFGCNKAPEQWETKTLAWPRNPITGEYFPKAWLIVYAEQGRFQTNVASLDTAATCLGQYGWELADTDNNGRIYHLKRHPQPHGDFMLSEDSIEDLEKAGKK